MRRLRPRPRSSLTIIHKSLCVLRSRLVRTMSLDEPHDKEARHGFPLTHQGFLERSTFHLPMESLDEPPCRDSMLHPLFKIEPHPPACLSDKGENRNWAGRLGHTNTHTCIYIYRETERVAKRRWLEVKIKNLILNRAFHVN
jgi:hypothetical protein